MEVTAAFKGITTDLQTLYTEIHSRGWTVSKLDTKDGQYFAEVKNPNGETVEKTGRDPQTALAAALSYVVRREFIRQGAWTSHWAEHLEPIAQAYAKAPVFDAQAAGAWAELAADCVARAQAIGQQLQIEVVDEPEPYHNPQELWKDVEKNKRLKVTRANSQHPLWNEDQVTAYRVCHDVLGHAAAGGDFGWTGENLATAAHMPYLSPSAQQALFTEAIGQSAYRNYYKGFGPQKIVFLNEFLHDTQDDQNPAGHGGLPVDHSLTPGPLPQGRQASESHTAGVQRDPNYEYSTGIVPPSINAVNSYGDPLDHMGIKDVAHKLNTNWSQWMTPEGQPDHERMKVAITNAFRAALLSPKKQLRWNAVHYQDLAHIPHHVSDPKVYWNALEQARVDHNRKAGIPNPEIAHKAHYEALLDFYRYYQKLHPEMNPYEAQEHADREVMVMQAEIEEKLIGEAKDPDLDIFEPKVFKALDKRLKTIVKDDKTRVLYSSYDAEGENPYQPATDKYGAFIGRYLISIAKLSRYADYLLEAALEDVKNHDGAGHHFRQAALSLDIPYVGPKIVSFAWLLLQPLTSQIATMDTHMCDLLGYKQADVSAPRDYFRLERELMAGRDAAGYSHMPLGQFQWSIWDHKRNGEGMHQDHSALRVWQPQSHHTIDWQPTISSPAIKGREYVPPEWWALTEPYRQNEVAKWNIDVAPFYPKGKIPWQNQTVPVHIASMPPACPLCGSLTLRHVTGEQVVECEHCHARVPVSGTDYSIHPQNVQNWAQEAGEEIPAELLWRVNDEMPTRHGSVAPQILEVDRNNWKTDPDNTTRRPYYHDLDNNVVYIGPAGAYHYQIEHHVPTLRRTHGYIALDGNYAVGNFDPGRYEDEGRAVNEAIAHHLGPPHVAYDHNVHGYDDSLWHSSSVSGDGNADELHLSLDVPERIREAVALWVTGLNLPSEAYLDPKEYHITMAYAPHGVTDELIQSATRRFNFTGLKFDGLRCTKFNDAVVIELECPHFNDYASVLNDWLEEQGAEVARYDGGYKPHITVAYTSEDVPSTPLPPLSFRAGRMNFSTPRPIAKGLTPWFASLVSGPDDDDDDPLAGLTPMRDLSPSFFPSWRKPQSNAGPVERGWQPGTWGKGLYVQGEQPQLYTWTTGTRSLMSGTPHHLAVAKAQGIPAEDFFDGMTDGRVHLLQINPEGQTHDCCHGKVLPKDLWSHPQAQALKPYGDRVNYGEAENDDLWEHDGRKEATAPMMYHVALQSARQSILTHGLSNTRSTDELWSNTDDWDDGTYLWDSEQAALAYQQELGRMGHATDLWTVNVQGLDVQPDMTGTQTVQGAWHVAQTITPDRLSLVDRLEDGPPKAHDTAHTGTRRQRRLLSRILRRAE